MPPSDPPSEPLSDPHTLIADLGGRSGSRRAAAVQALATARRRTLRRCPALHTEEAAAALYEAVDRGRRHSPREVRWALVELLRRWPDAAPAREGLAVLAAQGGPMLAEAALTAHLERGDGDAQAALLDEIAATGHPGRTAQALRLLGPACPTPRLAPHLARALRTAAPAVLLAALDAMPADLDPALRRALIDRALALPPARRRAAVDRLRLLPGEAELHPALAAPTAPAALAAVLRLLARSADQPDLAAVLLPAGLHHPRPAPFRAAAAVVAAHPAHRARLDDAWLQRLDQARSRDRHAVVDLLETRALRDDPASGLSLLARLARAADPWVRRRAAWRLARAPLAQAAGARRILGRLVDDLDPSVARTAGWSLHDLDQHVFHGERCPAEPEAQAARVPKR